MKTLFLFLLIASCLICLSCSNKDDKIMNFVENPSLLNQADWQISISHMDGKTDKHSLILQQLDSDVNFSNDTLHVENINLKVNGILYYVAACSSPNHFFCEVGDVETYNINLTVKDTLNNQLRNKSYQISIPNVNHADLTLPEFFHPEECDTLRWQLYADNQSQKICLSSWSETENQEYCEYSKKLAPSKREFVCTENLVHYYGPGSVSIIDLEQANYKIENRLAVRVVAHSAGVYVMP